MKIKLATLLSLLFLVVKFPVVIKATDYYISPTGSDSTGNGSLSSPWRNISKAASVVVAGDTVYLRGGVYNQTSTISISSSFRNGTSSTNMIKLWNYPGETPIFDYSNGPAGSEVIELINKNYWHVKGIEIRNSRQGTGGGYYAAFYISGTNNSIFENLHIHHTGCDPFAIYYNSTNNLVLNSDFHHNYDPYTDLAGDNANGIYFETSQGTINTVRGCRMWMNSDDGFDSYGSEGKFIIENNWLFLNGYYLSGSNLVHPEGGNGIGIKLGTTDLSSNESHYLIKNNLMFDNWASGLDQNGADKTMTVYNNTSYSNGDSTTVSWGGYAFRLEGTGSHIFKNNIGFQNVRGDGLSNTTYVSSNDHNSWNSLTATTSDFQSLSSTGVDGPRKADGSLPDLPFLKLSASSKFINAGVNVGIAYSGSAPDIGAFEYQGGGTTTPTPTSTSSPKPGDINGDGAINALDILKVLQQWGTYNATHILTVLSNWGR